ncbi:hypothetical protein [Ornithinicoccus halotolerans]|uniref:hypothetical protein n=1 Tax=Ornithinicoccus halotolerans TaxID=1748220 RepID=UPI001294A627|nr:hypothetical protein [Ornithinicoccus halotolerans]
MRGILAAVLALAVVGLPAGQVALLAVFSWTGCFIECGDPEPVVGLMWAGLSMSLFSVPVVVGLLVAGKPFRRIWPRLLVVAAVVLGGLVLLQRVA